MLECTFCKKTQNKECVNIDHLDSDMQYFIKENNHKYFKCTCGNQWVEINNEKELFNLFLFDKEIKTFKDFDNLVSDLNNDLKYYHIVPHVKDCLSRINDWLVSGGYVNDTYVTNILSNLSSINFFKLYNN